MADMQCGLLEHCCAFEMALALQAQFLWRLRIIKIAVFGVSKCQANRRKVCMNCGNVCPQGFRSNRVSIMKATKSNISSWTGTSVRRNAISAYLEPDDPNFSVVQEIEGILKIYHEFPAVRELVTRLNELLETAAKSARQEAWEKALRVVSELGEAAGWKYTDRCTSWLDNPLSEDWYQHLIPEFLLEKGYAEDRELLHGISMLFLNALLQSLSKELLTVAATLRFYFNPLLKLKIVKSLPMYTTSVEYNKGLSAFLEHVEWYRLDPDEKKFLDILQSLLDLQTPAISTDKEKVVSRRRRSSHQEVLSDVDERTQGGAVETFISEEADSINGESPQFAAVFVADVVPDESDADLIPTEQEIDSRARESRHWASRHQRLVAGDQGRLTSIERRHLVSFIRNGIDCGEMQKELVSGLLGLMYVTGQDLESLLSCSVGPGGNLGQMGTYRRDLSPPSDAFKPTSAVTSFLEPNAEWIDLQLPEPLGEWLIARYRNINESLGQCLGISLDQAGDALSKVMVELRDSGRFQRLRLERIPAALAIELTVSQHDPVVTFLLSSRPNHGAPMLSYYVAHPVELLASIYSTVSQFMMSIE